MRTRLLVAASATLVLSSAPALSAWTAVGTGDAAARTATLAPPTGLTAVRRTTGVELTWSSSASTWSATAQVLRAPAAAGPWTALTTLDRSTASHLDTTARAGAWFYAVTAVAGSWQAATPALEHRERVYVVRATSSFADARCNASGTAVDLQQGHGPAAGGGSALALTTITACTDAWSAGQVLPAGTTLLDAWLQNTGNRSCTFDVELLHNGTTSLGLGSGTVAAGVMSAAALQVAVTSSGLTLVDGDRLALRLTGRANSKTNSCGGATLHVDGSSAPTRVTLAG